MSFEFYQNFHVYKDYKDFLIYCSTYNHPIIIYRNYYKKYCCTWLSQCVLDFQVHKYVCNIVIWELYVDKQFSIVSCHRPVCTMLPQCGLAFQVNIEQFHLNNVFMLISNFTWFPVSISAGIFSILVCIYVWVVIAFF